MLLAVFAACSFVSSADESLPFEEYHALVYGTAIEAEQRNQQSLIELEETIAGCMREQGFEYYPYVARHGAAAESQASVPPDPNSTEFRQQYGYGITTADTSPHLDPAWDDPDPNEDYRQSLDEPGRTAYDLALTGTPYESADGSVNTRGGCYAAALDAVYGHDPGTDLQWADLLAAMAMVDAQVAQSLEMASVDNDWSECMAGMSYPSFASPAEAEHSIWTAREGLTKPDSTGLMRTDNEGLAKLKQAEIALAVADYECQESVSYQSRLRAVTRQHQQRFVADHRDELEAWVLYETEQRSNR